MGWIMIFLCAVLVCLGGAFILTKLLSLVVFGGILLGIAVFLLLGLRDVKEQERRVIELFGKYFMTLKPGLQWLLPKAMKIRATISVWEQEIPLFSDQSAEIVLKDGNVIPKDAKVILKLKNPDTPYNANDGKNREGVYRAIYETPDWREFIEDRIENALRSHLGKFSVDDVVIEGKGGFNLADHREDVGLPNNELALIEADLARWGWNLLRITVTEFGLPPAIAKARADVQIRKREAEAAYYQAEREAEETGGAVIQMFCKMAGMPREEVEKAIRENPEDFVKKYQSIWEKSWDAIYRKMAIDGKAYFDGRTQNPLSDLIALWKRMPLGGEMKEGGEKKKEEKKE